MSVELGHWLWFNIPALVALGAALGVLWRQRRLLQSCEQNLRRQAIESQVTKATLCRWRTRCQDLFENVSVGLFQATQDGILLAVNRSLAEAAGYDSPAEMMSAVSDAGREFHIPEFYTRPECRVAAAGVKPESEKPVRFEAFIRRKTGGCITAAITLRRVEESGSYYLQGCVENLTEYKRSLELVEAQRDLGLVLSSASSLAEAFPSWMEAVLRATGMEAGEIYMADLETGTRLVEAKGFDLECQRAICMHCDRITSLLEAAVEPVYTSNQECECGQVRGCNPGRILRAILPVWHEGSRIAWLVLRSHHLREISSSTQAALEIIAAQMGGSIARLKLQETLSQSQRELRALFDSLDDFFIVIDRQGRIADANRALTERSGYSREELQGMSITRLYPLRLQLGEGGGGMLGGELSFLSAPLVAKSGKVIPVETRLGLGHWEGRSVIIGLGRDMTERRKAEEQTASLREKTALLKEIHHRVKNNLQIICSLLSLQSSLLEKGPALDAFRESQARIRAIALLHEKLYQSSDLSRLKLGEYLGALARDVVCAYNHSSEAIQFRLDADPINANQDTVMPCGLVVNELVTNACKYAFPDGKHGNIHLCVKQGPENMILIDLKDDGVGLPAGVDPRKSKTLGLQLVNDMVAQLQGSWAVDCSEGTEFHIMFPAEKN